jgi:hypothetical protein
VVHRVVFDVADALLQVGGREEEGLLEIQRPDGRERAA